MPFCSQSASHAVTAKALLVIPAKTMMLRVKVLMMFVSPLLQKAPLTVVRNPAPELETVGTIAALTCSELDDGQST